MATKTASAGPASTIRRHFPHERGEALSAEADSIGITRHFPRERGEALSAKTARSRRPHGASAEPAWSQRPHGATAAWAEPALPPYSVQHSHIDRIGLSRHGHEDRITQTAASAEPALSHNGGQHRQWSGKICFGWSFMFHST